MGSNSNSQILQPNAGRIRRSPGAVVRIMRIDESMSLGPDDMAIAPDWSTRRGNAMPRPMKSDGSDIS
jgi:hypothetical protein